MRLALYQPDIPQNTGTILRLATCLDVAVDIVEPCGFPLDDRRMRRAGMDYMDNARLVRHPNWEAFRTKTPGRLILMTTKAATPLTDFRFDENDTIVMGRESAGVPDQIHNDADARILIPMAVGRRSLNVAAAAAIALGEGLRQTGGYPPIPGKENERDD